jgi:hypothetical protein
VNCGCAYMRLPAVVTLLFLASLTRSAQADAVPPPTDAPTAASPPTQESERFRPFALTANPLSLLLQKFGANVEWLPARHHALVLSPSFQLGTLETPVLDTRHRILTVEAGYHYYSGRRGADGFYFGPSFVLSRESVEVEASTLDDLSIVSTRLALGGAFDVGGQFVASKGFTVGGGAGLMYLFGLGGPGTRVADGVHRDTVLPRLLFTIGYSF